MLQEIIKLNQIRHKASNIQNRLHVICHKRKNKITAKLYELNIIPNDCRGRGNLMDDVLFLKCYFLKYYLSRTEKRSIKNVTLNFSNSDFFIPQNSNRCEILYKAIEQLNQNPDFQVKLKVNREETKFTVTFSMALV